jgi:hypothetical protein
MQIRFLELISQIIIGCVEMKPGPKRVSYAIYSKKHLCMCKGIVGKIAQVS